MLQFNYKNKHIVKYIRINIQFLLENKIKIEINSVENNKKVSESLDKRNIVRHTY